MANRFWYTILYYLFLTEANFFICIGWVVMEDQVSKNYDEDISYSYYVMESKRMLQELM